MSFPPHYKTKAHDEDFWAKSESHILLKNTTNFQIYSACLGVLCLVTQPCPTLCDPMDCSPPGSSVHEDSPGKNTGVSCHALLQGIFPTQGLNPGLPHYRQIPSNPPRKPKNTGIGSLYLLQGIFPNQELNPGDLGFWACIVRPVLWADSLPTEPPRKPKNTAVVAYLSSRGSSRPRN